MCCQFVCVCSSVSPESSALYFVWSQFSCQTVCHFLVFPLFHHFPAWILPSGPFFVTVLRSRARASLHSQYVCRIKTMCSSAFFHPQKRLLLQKRTITRRFNSPFTNSARVSRVEWNSSSISAEWGETYNPNSGKRGTHVLLNLMLGGSN